MRVLHLSYGYRGGGAERCARELFERLPGVGVETQMWIGRHSEGLPAGVTYIPESWERWLSPLEAFPHAADWRHRGSIARLRSISKDEFDVVHLHNIYGGWLSMRSVRELTERMPCVWTLHDEWAPNRGLTSSLEGKMTPAEVREQASGLLRYVPYDRYHENFRWRSMRRLLERWMPQPKVVIAPSTYILNLCAKSGAFSRSRLVHIPHGTVMPEVRNAMMDRSEAKKSFGLFPGRPVVLMVAANLSEVHKGIQLGTRALKELDRSLGVQVLIVGRSDRRLKEQLRPLPIVASVAHDDNTIARAYRAADVTVIPSLAEALSYVALESLACSTPVIAFPIGGVPEVVRNGERGRVCEAIDPEEMSRYVSELLRDGEQRERLGRNGAAWVREFCGMERWLCRMKEIYREAVG